MSQEGINRMMKKIERQQATINTLCDALEGAATCLEDEGFMDDAEFYRSRAKQHRQG